MLIGAQSLRTRLLAGSILWVAMALIITGVILFQLFKGHLERQLDTQLHLHLDELLSRIEISDKDLVQAIEPLSNPRFRKPFSGMYWQVITENDIIFRSRSLWDISLPFPKVMDQPEGVIYRQITGPQDTLLRSVERIVFIPGKDIKIHLIVAADGDDVTNLSGDFAQILSIALLLLAIGLVLTVIAQVTIGLRPLNHLREELSLVHEGRKKILEGPFSSETKPLVEELNALILRYNKLIERARTHASNLSHGLKTPLTILQNEVFILDEVLDDKHSEIFKSQLKQIERLINYHLARANVVGNTNLTGQFINPVERARALAKILERVYENTTLTIEADLDVVKSWKIDPVDFDELLGNLMDNACKWSNHKVLVSFKLEFDIAVISVDDDGPGLPADQREAVFQRGLRLDENAPGSGIGLAIVRDIAQTYEGHVVLTDSPLGGLRVELRFNNLNN